MILQLCVWTRHWRAPSVESAHPFYLPVNDLDRCKRFDCRQWYVLIPVGFDFLIAELVKLLSISFINLYYFIGYILENGSDYYLTLLCIALLFNDGVLRTITHYECFPVKGINVWLLIQCWDNRQSFIIDILGLRLICSSFYYLRIFDIQIAFTYELLCNWKSKWNCSCKGIFVFSNHSNLIF